MDEDMEPTYDEGEGLAFETSKGISVLKKFSDMGLRQQVLRGLYQYGFEKPSAIQQRAIVPIAAGRDIIAQAQSGTGKSSMLAIATCQLIDPKMNEYGSALPRIDLLGRESRIIDVKFTYDLVLRCGAQQVEPGYQEPVEREFCLPRAFRMAFLSGESLQSGVFAWSEPPEWDSCLARAYIMAFVPCQSPCNGICALPRQALHRPNDADVQGLAAGQGIEGARCAGRRFSFYHPRGSLLRRRKS